MEAEKEYELHVKRVLPSELNMISGISSNNSNNTPVLDPSELPNTSGKSGGACTAAFLQTVHQSENNSKNNESSSNNSSDNTWSKLITNMQQSLKEMGYEETIPQLSSTRLLSLGDDEQQTTKKNKKQKQQPKPKQKADHFVVPTTHKNGNKRAVLIGINYSSSSSKGGELRSCHHDSNNIKEYLVQQHGFQERDMLLLRDDDQHSQPTKENIFKAFQKINEYSIPGDVVFLHFSGHGGRIKGRSGEHKDTIIPVDFETAGHIDKDDIIQRFILPMAPGVAYTMIIDCCHATNGTVIDLPFVFRPPEENDKKNNDGRMTINTEFRIEDSLESYDEFLDHRKKNCAIM